VHPKMRQFEDTMVELFKRIDGLLEDQYYGRWTLARNRPKRGETANPLSDGLFDVGAFFTPGYGSRYGRGYLVRIDIKTHETITAEKRAFIEQLVNDYLVEFLPQYFPDRELSVVRDGVSLKIIGNFSLGAV
jgi:hypothetical protein